MKKSLTLTAMGLFVASASLSVAQTPIYQTGFESSGDPSGVSFSAGNLNGQGGWEVSQGAASVTSSAPGAAEGSQYVNQTTNSIVRRTITGASGDRAVVRGKYYGSGSATLTLPTTANPVAALVGFETVDGSSFSIKAYNGTTDSFVAGSGTFSNTQWHDIDLNIRYATASQPNSFDVNVNGVPYLTAIPFADNTVSSLNGFESHAETSSNTDGLGFFTSDGDFDNDGFSDDVEFADPNLNPFEIDQARSFTQAITNPTIPNDQLNSYSFPAGVEHWLPIDVSGCTNIQITATSTNGGDIQLQLYDGRPNTDVSNPSSIIRISESYVGLTESLTYVNNTGASTLFLRVYEEGDNSELEYDIQVSTISGDDAFEPNPNTAFPGALPLGSTTGLILKDDDFYRIDTTGLTNLDVTLTHDFDFGQIYFQILEDDGGFNPIGGGFAFNQDTISLTGFALQGRNSVILRVYGAALVSANFYDLNVSASNSEVSQDFVFSANTEELPPRFVPEYLLENATSLVAAKGADDGFEENDLLDQSVLLPTDVTNSNLVQNDEDWYYLDLSDGDSVQVNVNFSDAQGDIGLEIYEARCFFSGDGSRVKVAQSYNVDQDFESANYVNNTGNDRIYVRIYDQTPGETNPSYSIFAETFTDDAFEVGGTPANPAVGLPTNQKVSNLVLRDDDFFRIDTSGVSTLSVEVEHDFNLGQLYVQVLNDDGSFSLLNGISTYADYTANSGILSVPSVDVSSNNSAVIRVYAANRGTNFYNLTVNTTP